MTEQWLIDADTLLKTLEGVWDCNDMVFEPNDHVCNVPNDCKGCKWRETLDFVKRIVKSSKSVNAVQVVRCKDCAYSNRCSIREMVNKDKRDSFYCGVGQPKDGDPIVGQ